MGVFAGGFTLQLAEEVCGVEAGAEGVLDALGTLVENHLVERSHVTGGEETTRHDLLETIHEFAQEQLAASGETDLLRRRHAEAYVRLGEEAETELHSARQGLWLRRLEAEAHNVRAALAWCLEADEPELGLRLAGAIWMFWSKRGHASEGDRWLADLLARPGPVSAAIRSKALNGAAGIAYVEGDLAHAEAYLEEAIALRTQLGDERGRVKMLANLGMIATYRGDYGRARRLLEETRALNSSLGETRALANDLLNLANLAVYENDLESAVPLYEDSLEHFRLAEDTGGIANALGDFGAGLLYHGAYERARQPLEKSVELFRSLEDGHGVAAALINLGVLALCESDASLAISLLRESLSRLHEFGERRALAACLDHLAQAATALGDHERGARLMGGAEALRTGGGFPRAPGEEVLRDQALARVRALLGEGALNAAWAMGAALPLESLIQEALAVTAPPSL